MEKNISDATLNRLFRYYKLLCSLAKTGEVRISSAEIGKSLGITPSGVRQDLNALGCFGQQGYGYNIHSLIEELAEVAYLNKHRGAVFIGVDAVGRAIASSLNFDDLGFHLLGIFDRKEALTGQIVRGLPIRHLSDLDEFCRENLPKAAIICLPAAEAGGVATQLAGLGIKGIWNLSPCELPTLPSVVVENLDLGQSLMRLSFLMS